MKVGGEPPGATRAMDMKTVGPPERWTNPKSKYLSMPPATRSILGGFENQNYPRSISHFYFLSARYGDCRQEQRERWTNQNTRDEHQWIVALRLLSALTIPGIN